MEKRYTEESGPSGVKVLIEGEDTITRLLGVRTGRIIHQADPKIIITGEQHELAIVQA